VTAADLRDAPALAFLPTRLRVLRGGRYFVCGGKLPRRAIEIVECDAFALVSDQDDSRGDAKWETA
jgi:hypothetical protein